MVLLMILGQINEINAQEGDPTEIYLVLPSSLPMSPLYCIYSGIYSIVEVDH